MWEWRCASRFILFCSIHYCQQSSQQTVWASSACIALQVPNLNVLNPLGTTGRGAKALWECRASTWRTVVRWVKTCAELAEEDGRDPSAGSQQDQEHFLKLRKCGLKTPQVLWQSAVKRGATMDMLSWRTVDLYQDSFLSLNFSMLYCFTKLNLHRLQLRWFWH